MATSSVCKKKAQGCFNRYHNSFSESKTRGNNTAPSKEDYGIFNNPELLHLLCRGVMGTIIEVTTVDDRKLYGLVKCASPAGGFGIELSHPPTGVVSGKSQNKQSNLLLIESKDIKCMIIRDVNLEDCFKSDVVTDQEITNKVQIENGNKKPHVILTGKPGVLNLQPFFPNESQSNEKSDLSNHQQSSTSSDSPIIPEESLDDSAVEKKGDHWFSPQDMFHVNQEKYRVSSSYKEDMEQYTIKIDTTSLDYAEKATRAEKLANEIEKAAESVKVIDLENCNEENEEKLFSAVGRMPIEQSCENSSPIINDDSTEDDLSKSDQKEKKDDDIEKVTSITTPTLVVNAPNSAYLNPEAPVFLPVFPGPPAALLPPNLMRAPLISHNPAAPIVYPSAPIPMDPQHTPIQPFGAYVVQGAPYSYPYDPMSCIQVSAHQYMYPSAALPYPAYYSSAAMPGIMSPRGVPVTASGMVAPHHPAMMYQPHLYHPAMHHPMPPPHHSNHRPTSSAASVISNNSHSTNHHSTNHHNQTKNTSTSP